MKLDVTLEVDTLATIPALAEAAENLGFDAIWASAVKHDPFLELTLAANHTIHIQLATGIALAFTRSPMELAYTSWDLQELSQGRFFLGLGSQVKGHIERRFSIPWQPPIPKMRETIQALHAIWKTWQHGEKLDFKGKYHNLTLMTPFFSPQPIPHPNNPIYIAAVNRGMSKLAGELCQGLVVHAFHTPRYLKEVIIPAVEEGAHKTQRTRSDLELAGTIFTAAGNNKEEIQQAREAIRQQIAFYGSTRSYRAVFQLHGWNEVSNRLHRKSVTGDWAGMPSEISYEILDEFTLQGRWDELPDLIKERYNHLLDRVRLYLPFDNDPHWKELTSNFRK